LDIECRDAFLQTYKILQIRYFEETVFPDTTTTVVAFAFERSYEVLKEQEIEWTFLPSKQKQKFKLSSKHSWIVGGEIYSLPFSDSISIRRHVEGVAQTAGEQLTSLTLNALDSGTEEGRICLNYKKDYVYPALHSSRTYAKQKVYSYPSFVNPKSMLGNGSPLNLPIALFYTYYPTKPTEILS
jgi:hypothetical protein